jgi:hypothetical protein
MPIIQAGTDDLLSIEKDGIALLTAPATAAILQVATCVVLLTYARLQFFLLSLQKMLRFDKFKDLYLDNRTIQPSFLQL